jgi:DNA-directed RNA polymerase specialized sigma24 family protein
LALLQKVRGLSERRLRLATPLRPASDPAWSALMACAQDGHHAAYRELLTGIASLIRCWGGRQGIDGPACEALVGATLMAVHRVRHTYDDRRPFLPWLLGVLREQARRQGCPMRVTCRTCPPVSRAPVRPAATPRQAACATEATTSRSRRDVAAAAAFGHPARRRHLPGREDKGGPELGVGNPSIMNVMP